MGRELEFKYALQPADYRLLQERFAPFREISMETTYYDTPDGALSHKKWTLRRRWENGVSVCTLKTPGQDGARGEWEVPAPDIAAGIPALLAAGAPAELAKLELAELIPLCGAKFTRLAKDWTLGVTRVELALDSGEALGGGRSAPILELEVELKSGRDEDAKTFAQALAEEYGLVPQPLSKFRRARALAEGNV